MTTAQSATAQIRIANPSDRPANVTVDVGLGEYKVPPQTTTINPYSTGAITITPNPAIPVDGYASLTLHSSVPVVTGLATGTGAMGCAHVTADPEQRLSRAQLQRPRL